LAGAEFARARALADRLQWLQGAALHQKLDALPMLAGLTRTDVLSK
jgi:hypothetical protein